MKQLSVMIKPASGLCNMRCKYCFYADVTSLREVHSYGIMPRGTADALLHNILCDLSPGDSLSLAFQGGEPTLAGLDWFRHFVACAKGQANGVRLHWAFQTNGLVLDNDWCAFFKEHDFLVGLSLDFALHDQNRPDAEGHGTLKRILAAKQLLEKHGVEYNVLCVLTNALARHPAEAWRFIQQHKIRYVQFIPCLAGLEQTDEPAAPYTLTPERFAQFYNGLFPLWLAALQRGRYTSIKLFDDVVNLLRGQVSACGLAGQCMPQFVVEADGSVYPCDFYVLDETRVGSLATETIRTLFESPGMAAFRGSGPPLPALCGACPYARLCGGGCKRMRQSMYVGSNPAFCGYRAFLEKNLPALQTIAQQGV